MLRVVLCYIVHIVFWCLMCFVVGCVNSVVIFALGLCIVGFILLFAIRFLGCYCGLECCP